MPAAARLKGGKVTVQLQEPWQKAGFFLVGFPHKPEPVRINTVIRAIEAQGVFKFEKSYHVPVRFFGQQFNLARFPQDLTYPFPMILLFRAKFLGPAREFRDAVYACS